MANDIVRVDGSRIVYVDLNEVFGHSEENSKKYHLLSFLKTKK